MSIVNKPLDGGIVPNFKVKYRKTLVQDVLLIINENVSVADIGKELDMKVFFCRVSLLLDEYTFLTKTTDL